MEFPLGLTRGGPGYVMDMLHRWIRQSSNQVESGRIGGGDVIATLMIDNKIIT